MRAGWFAAVGGETYAAKWLVQAGLSFTPTPAARALVELQLSFRGLPGLVHAAIRR